MACEGRRFETPLATRRWHPRRSVNSGGVPPATGRESCVKGAEKALSTRNLIGSPISLEKPGVYLVMNLADMRTDYRRGKLRREDLDPIPSRKFSSGWRKLQRPSNRTNGQVPRHCGGLMACRGLEQCCLKDWTPEGSFFYQPVEMAWEGIKEKFGDGAIPLPPFWGGYRVLPETIEFWQGG